MVALKQHYFCKKNSKGNVGELEVAQPWFCDKLIEKLVERSITQNKMIGIMVIAIVNSVDMLLSDGEIDVAIMVQAVRESILTSVTWRYHFNSSWSLSLSHLMACKSATSSVYWRFFAVLLCPESMCMLSNCSANPGSAEVFAASSWVQFSFIYASNARYNRTPSLSLDQSLHFWLDSTTKIECAVPNLPWPAGWHLTMDSCDHHRRHSHKDY